MAGPLAYIESPLSIEPLATLQPACAGAPDRAPRGTGQMSGALWPSTCVSIERQPFTPNGHEPFSSRYARTGHFTVHGTGTGQMSGASPPRAPSSTESTRPPDRRAPDKRPVRCSVRCVRLSAKTPRVSHRTERRGTGHVRCTPRATVRCFAPLCLARPRASLHRTVATGQHLSVRCSVRCSSEHFSQLLSPPLLTTTNTKVFHHLVHVC